MALTPLEVLMMGTRCGSIDPAIVPFLMEKEGLTARQLDDIMNKKSGILGIHGKTSDNREIEDGGKAGDPRCVLIESMLVHQLVKYIGSYAAAMNGLDAIVFTAGIGENNPHLREIVCEDMEFFGIEFNKEANIAANHPSEAVKISKDSSKVAVYVIPTNEELVIAQDTAAIVSAL
jgi:acetate kinase